MTRTRTVITALSCLSVLALGACSDDDPEPKFAPTPTTSAPTSPSTTAASGPTIPTMPAAAQKQTDVGAEAFVRYWIEMVNFAQRTGETASLERLNDVRCTGCRGMVKAIDAAYGSGGHIEGGELSAGRLRELPLDFGAEWAAFAQARTATQVVVQGDGSEETHEGAPFDLYTYVDWDDGWSMRWLRTPS